MRVGSGGEDIGEHGTDSVFRHVVAQDRLAKILEEHPAQLLCRDLLVEPRGGEDGIRIKPGHRCRETVLREQLTLTLGDRWRRDADAFADRDWRLVPRADPVPPAWKWMVILGFAAGLAFILEEWWRCRRTFRA